MRTGAISLSLHFLPPCTQPYYCGPDHDQLMHSSCFLSHMLMHACSPPTSRVALLLRPGPRPADAAE